MKLLYIATTLLLSGCSLIPVDSSKPQLKIGDLSMISDVNGDAKIGIVRNKNVIASMLHYWPIVSGEVVGGILTGDAIEFYVSAGHLTLDVACFGGWSQSWKVTEMDLDVNIDDKRYFLLSPHGSSADICVDIDEISEVEFNKALTSGRKISVGTISSR